MNELNSSTTAVTLQWEPTIRLCEVPTLSKQTATRLDAPGVYVWTITPPGRPEDEYLAYVGRATLATRVLKRFRDHYLNQISGHYWIPEAFRSGDEWSVDWNSPPKVDVLADQSQFIKLVEQGFDVARASRMTASLLDPQLIDVRAIERQLLWDLQPSDTSWGCRSMPSSPIRLNLGNAPWATDAVKRNIQKRWDQLHLNRTLASLGLA